MNFPLIPPWVKPLAIAVLIGVAIGAIYAYGQQQFGLGEKAERTAWLERENLALARANTRIKELVDQARAKEREHAQDMAAASAKYQEDLKDEKAARDRTVADLRSGALRLRIALARPVCADATGRGAASAPDAGTSGRDGETRAELSASASEFLVGLTSEADKIVRQLTACQVVVSADRKQQGEQ